MAILAQSDVGIELWASDTGLSASFEKLVDVFSVPATGSAKGKIDVTVLSSTKKQYIADREDLPDLEFGFHYTAENVIAVNGVAEQLYYFMIVYGDGTGVVIYGEANRWTDAVSAGQAVNDKFNIVPQSIDEKTALAVTALKVAS